MGMPARGGAAFSIARRFASASTTRCRSAHLVQVQPNYLLPIVRISRRAPAMPPRQATAELIKSKVDGDCVRLPIRRQSDSEDRGKSSRLDTSLGRHPITRKGYATSVRQQSCQRLCNRQALQLFEAQTGNGGVKGQSPLRSLGGIRGPFSHVREWPPYHVQRLRRCSLPAGRRE